MKGFWRLITAGAATLALAGCVMLGDKLDQFRWTFMTVPVYVFDNIAGYKNPPQSPVMEEPVTLAVAISGGGSRSAVFSSAILEQLAYMPDPRGTGRSVLDGVDVISGVSGGSLATSYYSLYKPNDFSNQDQAVEFFQKFKSNMTVDFHMRGVAHYLTHPWEAVGKYYTRYRFVQTLGETFDQHIFKGADFNHLLERELAGEAPTTIVNATCLDTGKKFLFTNLNVQQNWIYDPASLLSNLPSIAKPKDVAGLTLLGKIAATPIYQPYGFDAINSDIGAFRIAHAVATSCAYPVVPGPATLMNYAQSGYVHLADGGVNDNSGVDSILGLYVSHLAKSKRPGKLVVLAISVSRGPEPKEQQDPDGYVSTIDYADRASSAMGTRAQTMAALLYNSTSAVRVINLNLTDASYHKQIESQMAALAISERDALTLLNAASELVNRHREEITASLK